MGKIGVAVIGVGAWGKNHARVFKELENTELVFVCDINDKRAVEVAEKYGSKWTTNYLTALESKEVEAVSICTPASNHYKIAMEAVKYGKHLLIEKPMSGETLKARKIAKEAKRKGLILYVGFIERFNPGVERVVESLEKGEIGEVVLISSRRLSRWPIRVSDLGVVKDTAIHDFDLFRFLLRDEPEQVYAMGGRIRHKFEDYVEAFIRFKKGKVGFIEANWLTPRKTRKMTVTGVDGIIHLDFLSQEVILEKMEGTYIPSIKWEEPLKNELKSFVRCIEGEEEAKVTGEDGVRALEIADAVLKSMKEGKPVKM